jgi:hypothetical protein
VILRQERQNRVSVLRVSVTYKRLLTHFPKEKLACPHLARAEDFPLYQRINRSVHPDEHRASAFFEGVDVEVGVFLSAVRSHNFLSACGNRNSGTRPEPPHGPNCLTA